MGAALTIRLKRQDKATLTQLAGEAGLEAGTAARQVLEMFTAALRRNDGDFIGTLNALKEGLRQ